jgi:hypothetical protein
MRRIQESVEEPQQQQPRQQQPQQQPMGLQQIVQHLQSMRQQPLELLPMELQRIVQHLQLMQQQPMEPQQPPQQIVPQQMRRQRPRPRVQKESNTFRTFLKDSDFAKEDINRIVKKVEDEFDRLLQGAMGYNKALEILKKRYADIKNALLAIKQLENREPWTGNPTQSEFKGHCNKLRSKNPDHSKFLDACENMCKIAENNQSILSENDYLCISNMLMLVH